MLKRIAVILCVAVFLAAFGASSVAVINAERTASQFDTISALTTDADKLAVSLSAIYKRAGDLVLSLPYASINLCRTAMMKAFAGESDAKVYLDARSDDQLANAYAAMEDILNDYDAVMTRYGVGTGSTHRTNRDNLAATFLGLKSASTELVRRARTFINYSDSGYASYYTAYCDQLQILSEKLESAALTIGNCYDSLVGGVSSAYLGFCTAYKQAGEAALTVPYASLSFAQTAVTKLYSGETYEEVVIFLTPRTQGELQTVYGYFDSALVSYDTVLSDYNVPAGSTYRTKRVELSDKLDSLQTASKQLVSSVETLAGNATDANYNTYVLKANALYDTFKAVHEQINSEYNALIVGLLGSDSELIF